MIVKEVCDKSKKKEITKSVLEDLPEWFGIEESTKEYIEESAEMIYYACFIEDEAVGFVAIKTTSSCTAEIYVIGIKKEYHRRGIGKLLVNKCIEWCIKNKFEYLQVKTLDPSNPDKYYAKTREFYKFMGFKNFECIETLWGKENPCLIMIRNV